MDTRSRAQVDQQDAWQRDTIRRHGWAIRAVPGDGEDPPFAYTVGLTGFGHPELILFATSPAAAATVLNGLGELVRAGRRLAAGEHVRLPGGGAVLAGFPEAEHWLFAADDLYRLPGGPPVPALLVIPDDDPEPGRDGCCPSCA
jgi:hypothetical protein